MQPSLLSELPVACLKSVVQVSVLTGCAATLHAQGAHASAAIQTPAMGQEPAAM
jgi:hypothetical protein